MFLFLLQAITPPANAATTGPLPAAAALAAAAVSAKIQAQDAVSLGGKLIGFCHLFICPVFVIKSVFDASRVPVHIAPFLYLWKEY